MFLNILISIIILYIFSWLFVFIDNIIDDLYYFIKDKLNKNKEVTRKWSSVDEMINSLKNNWLRDKYLYIYRFFLHIKKFPIDFYFETKWFIQRGKNGYADCDVWGFDNYLSEVIVNGLKDLKSQVHGVPSDFASKDGKVIYPNKWKSVLDEIIWTFEVAQKIIDAEWVYLNSKERNKKSRIKFAKKGKYHIMTKIECSRYRNGWKLFKKYYFNLWD